MTEIEKVIATIQNFVIDKEELYNIIKKNRLNFSMTETLTTYLNHSLNNSLNENYFPIEIESILDFMHDELYTGHWSQVPVQIRQAFVVASFIKSIILLKTSQQNLVTLELLRNCLKCFDLGLLLGAPLDVNSDLLNHSAKYLSQEINQIDKNVIHRDNKGIKRKLNKGAEFVKFNELKAIEIDAIQKPSLEFFNKNYFIPQIPVKLQDCMAHWPAITKWLDVNYLLEIAGDRTVPVELGSHYVDENWSQKLMTLKEFITNHYLSDDNQNMGYLAQHNLFDQINELRNDIHIPEYCCLSTNYETSCEPDINAWFGPKGTVSPLHQDPKNNILTQVFGTKQLVLFSPKDTPFLYPHEGKLLSNTAKIDPIRPDLVKFPEFSKSSMCKCLLKPGEMLFIPVKWWHHVTALDKSFSVSFWWQ